MAKKSASDLVGQLAGMAEEIQTLTVTETRKYVALEVKSQFLGGPQVSRRTYSGRDPDDCIIDALRDGPTFVEHPRFVALLERFDQSGDVSEDFRLGILFAATLFEDPEFDY